MSAVTPRKRNQIRQVWYAMIYRCTNENSPAYRHYGGRGITVCDRWRLSFAAFAADMGPRPANGTLERIDNDGSYTPENCRWASRREQAENHRRSRLLTWNGKTQCVAAWARQLGIPAKVLHGRLRIGWSTAAVLTRPRTAGPVTYRGKTQSLAAWAQELQISHSTLRQRFKLGWSVAESLAKSARPACRLIEYRGEIRSLAGWARKLQINYTTLAQRLNNGWSVDKALSTPVRRA